MDPGMINCLILRSSTCEAFNGLNCHRLQPPDSTIENISSEGDRLADDLPALHRYWKKTTLSISAQCSIWTHRLQIVGLSPNPCGTTTKIVTGVQLCEISGITFTSTNGTLSRTPTLIRSCQINLSCSYSSSTTWGSTLRPRATPRRCRRRWPSRSSRPWTWSCTATGSKESGSWPGTPSISGNDWYRSGSKSGWGFIFF